MKTVYVVMAFGDMGQDDFPCLAFEEKETAKEYATRDSWTSPTPIEVPLFEKGEKPS